MLLSRVVFISAQMFGDWGEVIKFMYVHVTRFKECIISVVFLPGISWEWFFHKNVYGNSMFFSEISAVTSRSPYILFFWVNI